ncbi:hypothetical protein [Streptomyces sp. YIM S03343]
MSGIWRPNSTDSTVCFEYHVILCWLALLLIRIIETQAGNTWTQARREPAA